MAPTNCAELGAKAQRTRAALVSTAAVLLVIGIAAIVWTMRFSYQNMEGKPVRINRFTGTTEVLSPFGWISVDGRVASQEDRVGRTESEVVDLPASEFAKLQGRAEITRNLITLFLENRSSYEIKELTIQVVVHGKDADDVKTRRAYQLTSGRRAGEFIAGLGFELGQDQGWTWSLQAARGTPRTKAVQFEGVVFEFPADMSTERIGGILTETWPTNLSTEKVIAKLNRGSAFQRSGTNRWRFIQH